MCLADRIEEVVRVVHDPQAMAGLAGDAQVLGAGWVTAPARGWSAEREVEASLQSRITGERPLAESRGQPSVNREARQRVVARVGSDELKRQAGSDELKRQLEAERRADALLRAKLEARAATTQDSSGVG